MKFLGMIIGGIFTVIGHTIAFMFKTAFIAVRRFTMDPANKNAMWNIQAFTILFICILCFLWMVGKYQDLILGIEGAVLYRSIPLLIPCFFGHLIYSCPVLFKSTYAKPIIQTFLNALSIMAVGQIVIYFMPGVKGIIIAGTMFIGVIALTLYYTLHKNIRSTVFNKLTRTVEVANLASLGIQQGKRKQKDKTGQSEEDDKEVDFAKLDLNQIGCLSNLRYYSEECKLELFNTVPTKELQSELMVLNRNDRAQHAQIIGGTGAGKTLLATNLVTQDLLNDFIGSTIIEPKGSFINRLSNFMERTGRTYRRLDPEYEFTDCLNPFYVPDGQDIEPMIEANVSAFHGYLGPDSEQYFKSRSTQLMRVGIKALKMVMGNDCTYNELNRLIQPINDDFRAEILSELIGSESEVPLLLEYTRNMASGGKLQEHAMQTYSNLYDYLSELTSNKYIQRIFCRASTFNIDDSLKNGEVVLVNGAYGTLQTLTYTVGRLYINLLRASTFRRNLKEKVRPHQLTVDELEMFADEEFSTFLEMAREFEVYVNVIHQGNVQLSDVSERLGVMVKQNAVQKFILAGLDNEDTEYYADMIGEDYQIGQSSGTDEMSTTGFKTQLVEEKRYRILPSEILRLKGFNPETKEAGECLFRGVKNNVRLDPVIGLIEPLPRELFTPLKSELKKLTSNESKDNQDVIENKNNNASEGEGISPTSSEKLVTNGAQKVSKLEQIKRKAKEIKHDDNKNITDIKHNNDIKDIKDIKSDIKDIRSDIKDTNVKDTNDKEQRSSTVVRNSAWDSGSNEVAAASSEKENSIGKEGGKRNVTQQVTVSDAMNELEQRLAEKAQNGRNKRVTETR